MTDAASRFSNRQTSISACPELMDKWYCLNGATCFQVKIYDATLYNCWCPSGYQGLRCDYKYVEKRDHHNRNLISSGLNENIDSVLQNQTQQGSLTSRQSTKQNYIIAFNLLMLSLLLLAFVLFLIWKTRRRTRSSVDDNATMDDHHAQTGVTGNVIEQNTRQGATDNEHINYDSLSTRLSLNEQEKRAPLSHQQRFVIHNALTIGQLEERKQLRNQPYERDSISLAANQQHKQQTWQ